MEENCQSPAPEETSQNDKEGTTHWTQSYTLWQAHQKKMHLITRTIVFAKYKNALSEILYFVRQKYILLESLKPNRILEKLVLDEKVSTLADCMC